MNDKLIIYLVLAVSVLFVILIVTIPPSTSSSNSMQMVPLQNGPNFQQNVHQSPQPLYHPQPTAHPSQHQPQQPPQQLPPQPHQLPPQQLQQQPHQPLKESYKALEIKTVFNKKVEQEAQTDQQIAPQMTLKYEKINQVPHNDIETIIANGAKENLQMELVNEMKNIPVAPEALEGPEIVCEKGICVRKHPNPFGTIITANDTPSSYVMIEHVKSRYVKPTMVNDSNPFNL